MKRFLLVLCAVLMLLFMFAGCKGGKDNSGSKDDSSAAKVTDVHQLTGNVTCAIPAYTFTETDALVKEFMKKYPGIKVTTVKVNDDTTTWMKTKATSKELPDMLFEDWQNVPFYITSDYLMPVNKYFNADDESKYVPKSFVDNLTYDGKIYALPCKLEFEAIFMNMNLLDTLNLDKPSYDWNYTQFKDLVKKATTKNYSGVEKLWGFDEKFAAESSDDAATYGYNVKTHTYNFEKAWVPAVNKMMELRKIPGLEAWKLRGNDGANYKAKFGVTNLADYEAAFKAGKVLCDAQITSERGWMRMMPFEVDAFPFPHEDNKPQKIGMHANSSYMTSTCKNPEATYQLLKWLTYGYDGQSSKLKTFLARDPDKETSGLLEYFPPTTNPKIAEMIQGGENILPGFKYLYKHMDNIYRADLNKIVPNWEQICNDHVNDPANTVRNGDADAATVAKQLDTNCNKTMSDAYKKLDDYLAAHK